MRFTILENYTIGNVSKEEFDWFVKNSCSEYVKQKEHWDLYRGIPLEAISESQERFITKPNWNRKPKDTNWEIHKFVDDFFFHKFGWYSRSGAVFASGSATFAYNFGTVWKIYPSNGFKFLWSPDVHDLFDEACLDKNTSSVEKVNDKLAKYILPTYIDTNLIGAIKSGNEIMIKCDQYGGEIYE